MADIYLDAGKIGRYVADKLSIARLKVPIELHPTVRGAPGKP